MFYQGPGALPDAHPLCLPGLETGCLLRWFAEHLRYIYNHTHNNHLRKISKEFSYYKIQVLFSHKFCK